MAVENRGPQLQAVAYTLLVTAVISVLLRTYVRVMLVRNFGVDDWCMVAATISFILFVTSALVGVHYGTGRHYWDIPNVADQVEALKYWWFCYLWYCVTMIASKISIGYFLLRITVRKIDIWIIHGVMATTVLTGIVFFFVTLFQCKPVHYFWDKSGDGQCVPIDVIIALTYLYSVFSVICDFTFALLPVYLISKLNMDRKTKLALIPLVLMACAASSAVVVRFAYVKDFKNPDFLYATVDIAIWSTTEQGLAITAGSLATIRPLFRRIMSRLGFSTGNASAPLPSGDPIPSRKGFNNIGGGSGSGSKAHRGPFSLTTFMNKDEESNDDHTVVSEQSNDRVTKNSDNKNGASWMGDPGDSEEELTGKAKGRTWDDRQYKVTITSPGRDE
ncbi:hypothetical protein F5X68DRAFT_270579 [Plectosphaerella plurivora]|uniref:Rhodopsin domain-containing protein n=1 Tax=Plectosphaerella plurivora TaxID=936078 RepID=A0A9P8V4K6_9PEZI|nr:hypothetical protein F5X68DRAFT_270579 [Plectosphaerella plurivora]